MRTAKYSPARRPRRTGRARPVVESLEVRAVLSQFVVSPAGSDAASGLPGSPWLTLQHAADVARPGDDIEVFAGRYAGFATSRGGAAVAPITFRADPGAIIDRPSATGAGIDLNGASYLDIEGFAIAAMPGDGFRSVSGAGVLARGIAATGSGGSGFRAINSAGIDFEGDTASNGSGAGFWISGGPGATIRGSVAAGNRGAGVLVSGDGSTGNPGSASGVAIDGNIVHDGGAGSPGIEVDGLVGGSIRNNVIYAVHGAGIALNPAANGAGSSGVQAINDTVSLASDGSWALLLGPGAASIAAADDILLGGAGAGSIAGRPGPGGWAATLTSDRNAAAGFSADGGRTVVALAAWTAATGQDARSFGSTAAALFAAPSTNDYHLSATSPAIDAGSAATAASVDLEGRARPARNAPDLGAYELPAVLASFVGQDDATQGTWVGKYGSQGYQVVGVGSQWPSYGSVTPSGQSQTSWNNPGTDPRALQRSPSDLSRNAGVYYTYSSFALSFAPTDAKAHRVSLYMVDWDASNTRIQQVDVLDPATGAVLDSRTVSSFSGGRYLSWNVVGPAQFRVTVIYGRTPGERNAVLSGIFLDPPSTAATLPTTPAVASTAPADVPGLPATAVASATFDGPIDPSNVSFTLVDVRNRAVPSTWAYDAARHVLTLTPVDPLRSDDGYTATLSGVGRAGAQPMAPRSWSFSVDGDPHGTDPIKQAEHLAIFDLVALPTMTAFAVRSGSWGDPSIWSNGAVPGAGARVDIPEGVAVGVDGRFGGTRLGALFVEGSLRFNPDVNTSLNVVTTVVGEGGYFEIGTAAHRVSAGVTAQFIIGNRGARDAAMRLADPLDYTGGFISHGTTSLFGSLHQGMAYPAAIPRGGDATVRFGSAPTGWAVGDSLLFAGLSLTANQDETRTIAAISADGLTYTLSSPLAYDHGGIYGYAQAAPVGDLTRNVAFISEDQADLVDRGHVMFMHSQAEAIDSVDFVGLGRTSAQSQITIPKLDANGALIPGTDANTSGRYPVHFHVRSGANYGQTPATIANSVILTSPKIGIDNHGGYALITGNITYQVDGSGIFTENGSEIGTIQGNMTVRSRGGTGNIDGRPGQGTDPNDYGFSGTGIWTQGNGVAVLDNFSSGQSSAAFTLFTNGIRDDSPSPDGISVFLAQNLKDPSIAGGRPYVSAGNVPGDFERNVGIASATGLITWDNDLFSIIGPARSIIAGSSFINNATGWENAYSRDFDLSNDRFIGGDPSQLGRVFYDSGIFGNIETANIRMTDVTIDGYANGYWMPTHGDNEIKGGFINGVVKLHIPSAYGGTLILSGITWGTSPGQTPYAMILTNDYSSVDAKAAPGFVAPMTFLYNGQTVYYDGQAANFAPFSGLATAVNGLTNQQLWNQYGLAIGGRIAPAGASRIADISGGMVGPDAPLQSAIVTPDLLFGGVYDWSVPQIQTYNPVGYAAAVTIDGTPYTSAPANLSGGWNVITYATPKGKRSILVNATTGA